MKRRLGFVSNSSSSSFICDTCGTIESGYDASYEDMGMKSCSNGHVFCEGHYDIKEISVKEKKLWLKDHYKAQYNYWFKEYNETFNITYKNYAEQEQTQLDNVDNLSPEAIEDNYSDATEGNLSEIQCPLCNLEGISQDSIEKFINKKYDIDIELIKKEIKSTFTSDKELMDYCK